MIEWELRSGLVGNQLMKMEEHVPPLVDFISSILKRSYLLDLDKIYNDIKKEIPYPVNRLTNSEIEIFLTNTTILKIDLIKGIRDLKIESIFY